MARRQSKLWQYWGLIPFTLLILSIGAVNLGPGMSALLTGLLIFYVLFQAPVWCGAENRKRSRSGVEYCRNNSYGLLLGCSLKQHKWQKLKAPWWGAQWRERTRGLWAGPAAKFATITGLIGSVTGIWGMFKG